MQSTYEMKKKENDPSNVEYLYHCYICDPSKAVFQGTHHPVILCLEGCRTFLTLKIIEVS